MTQLITQIKNNQTLYNSTSLPLYPMAENCPTTFQSKQIPIVSSATWYATAFAIWIHRLTNEEELTLHFSLKGQLFGASLHFTEQTTAMMIYEQIDNCLHHPLENSPEFIHYLFADQNNHLAAAMQLNYEEKNWYLQGANQFLNTQNEARYISYFKQILNFILLNQQHAVIDFSIVTEDELKAYHQINQNVVDYNAKQTMHEAFFETATKFPHKIALKSGNQSITFDELLKHSDSVAQLLVEQNINVGDYVAVYMTRSIQAVAAMLGVMKAGAIYVPLSPDNPIDRNKYILEDTQSKIILTEDDTFQYALQIAPVFSEIIEYNTISKKQFSANQTVQSTDLAYIIYTSGSTGRPKGVQIPHKSITTFAYGEQAVYRFKTEHVLTQFYTLTFDASMLELCPMIYFGTTLYMLSKEERIDISLFAEAVEKEEIDFVMMVPTSVLKQFTLFATTKDIEKMQRLQCFAVGGELLPVETVRQFQQTFGKIPLVNLYGPTECSVLTTFHPIAAYIPEEVTNIPIGSPLPNYKVHVLNKAMQYCPIDVAGELYIETPALAAGYLNLPDKTAEVFVKTPFSDHTMYRSGDVVRLSPTNKLEFVGRQDSQVKIRGFRVELDEIEKQLLKISNLENGVIITKILEEELAIIAYYKNKPDFELTTATIIEALQLQLPDYMLPTYCVAIDEFPLLPSGKINRHALRTLDISQTIDETTTEKLAPTTLVEEKILHSWQKVLTIDSIGIDEDFFEIGGHSLKVLAILSTLKKDFPMLKINDFFKYRTIQQLANYITNNDSTTAYTEKTATINNELLEHPKYLTASIQPKVHDGKHFFLTGATGYLGAHILLELLQSPVKKIAVLVRSSTAAEGLERLLNILKQYDSNFELNTGKNLDKIQIISGDFTKKDLGIATAERDSLYKTVDAILHCGADVRHFGDEEHFKKTNIDSTTYLIDFAKKCQDARFHYVSTIGIQEDLATEGNWDAFLQKESILDAPAVESLYTNSKLASEKLLQLAYEKGLAVSIYRPGNISCHSITGRFQTNIDANAVYRMFKSFILLKKAPNVDFMMDFTMVDYASSLITKLAYSKETVGGIYNICNTTLVSFKEVLGYFRSYGYTIDLVSEKEFTRFLYDETPKNAEGVALAMAGIEGDGAKNSDLLYRCPHSQQFMTQHGLVAPLPSESFFHQMIQYAITIQYFPMPNE